MTPSAGSEVERAFARVKIEAAALVVGTPFYVIVVVLLLDGLGQGLALGLYGFAAGVWLVGRTRRVVRSLAGPDNARAKG